MNTLERKKIKGGKYEYFLADKDGNFIEEVSTTQIFQYIKDCKFLIETSDEINDKKIAADILKLKSTVEDLFSLTTIIIEWYPKNK
jgi:hypothetical protein